MYEIDEGTCKLFIDGPADTDDVEEFTVKSVDELGQPFEDIE